MGVYTNVKDVFNLSLNSNLPSEQWVQQYQSLSDFICWK